MGIASQDPDPGKGKRFARWEYLSVPNGSQAVGFKAGRCFGCHVHFIGGSKPCRQRITKGALQCAYCLMGQESAWRGYCPLYTREYQRKYVMIPEDLKEVWDEIADHAQIVLTRPRSSKAPIIPQAKLWRTEPLPPAESREGEIDLLPNLLRAWKDAELAAWHHQTSDTPVSKTALPKTLDTEALALHLRQQQHAAERRAAEATKMANRLDGVPGLEGIGEGGSPPSKNGKHRKGS